MSPSKIDHEVYRNLLRIVNVGICEGTKPVIILIINVVICTTRYLQVMTVMTAHSMNHLYTIKQSNVEKARD